MLLLKKEDFVLQSDRRVVKATDELISPFSAGVQIGSATSNRTANAEHANSAPTSAAVSFNRISVFMRIFVRTSFKFEVSIAKRTSIRNDTN